MSDKTHIKITTDGESWNTHIYINGKELKRVIKIVIDASSGRNMRPTVKIEIAPDILEVEGDFKNG